MHFLGAKSEASTVQMLKIVFVYQMYPIHITSKFHFTSQGQRVRPVQTSVGFRFSFTRLAKKRIIYFGKENEYKIFHFTLTSGKIGMHLHKKEVAEIKKRV